MKVADGDTGKRAVDLHTVNEGGLRNHLESWDFLEDSIVSWSVEDNSVLSLVLDLALGPLLL